MVCAIFVFHALYAVGALMMNAVMCFGQLRSILLASDDLELVWRRVVRVLDRVELEDPALEGELLPYLELCIARWPVMRRAGSRWWFGFDATQGQWRAYHPAFRLANTLTLDLSRQRPDALPLLLDSPAIAQVEHLELYNSSPQSISQLLACDGAYVPRGLCLPDSRDEDLLALAQWPGLAKVRALCVEATSATSHTLHALLESPHSAQLEDVELQCRGYADGLLDLTCDEALMKVQGLWLAGVDPRGGRLEEFLMSPYLWRLERLTMSASQDVDVSRLMAQSLFFGQMKLLSLGSCGLDSAQMRSLCATLQAERFRYLEILNLSHNPKGTAGAQALSALSGLESLRTLELVGCGVDDQALATLAQAGALSRLETLSLGFNEVHGPGLEALVADEVLAPSLKRLHLPHCRLEHQAIGALARSPLATQLEALTLSSPHGAKAVHALGEGAGFPRLRALALINVAMHDQGACSLAQMNALAQVVELTLERCHIQHTGAKALVAPTTALKQVELLDLSHNKLGSRGANALLNAPASAQLSSLRLEDNHIGVGLNRPDAMPCLTTLNLSNNPLDDDSAITMSSSEAQLIALRELELSFMARHFTHEGLEAFVAGAGLGSLKALSLHGRRLPPSLIARLEAALIAKGLASLYATPM